MATHYFYKYYSINQNLYNSIINNELFFSNPRNFNDPFDSLPRFELIENHSKLKDFFLFIRNYGKQTLTFVTSLNTFGTISEQIKRTLRLYLNDFKKFSEFYYPVIEDSEERLVEIITFYSDDEYFEKAFLINPHYLQHKLYLDFVFLTIDYYKFGISCGSKKPHCPLMWGHYANNHTGVCIKYDFFDQNKKQNLCLDDKETVDILDVKYMDAPLKIFDYSPQELENLKYEIFVNKYSKWEYESEVRLIHKQGLLKIKTSCIKEIIFGCKSTPKDRYSLLKLFAAMGYRCEKLSIATILPDKYELNIEGMKMNDIAGSGVFIKELNLSNMDKELLKGII